MPLRFKHAPLVELIAEVRWPLQQMQAESAAGTVPQIPSLVDANVARQQEEQFLKFAANINAIGFNQVERIVPSGFPLMIYQPVYRFRNPKDKPGILFQIGAGLFTTNATQPYKSWREFGPIVEEGLSLLFSCISGDQKNHISQLTLRYIDLFDQTLLQDRSVWEFITETLQIGIGLPDALKNQHDNEESIKPNIQFVIPTEIGELKFLIAEGNANGVPRCLMDTTVSVTAGDQIEVETIMEKFNAAHDIIYGTFTGLTRPIHELMEITEE